MQGLAPIDAWALLAILAKAAEYGAALLAMGGPLFILACRGVSEDVLRLARRIALWAALAALALLALRFGIRAARISGMGVAGATDAMMLGFVWQSPLGTATLWRGVGEALVLGMLVRGGVGLGAGVAGAVLIAVSYTFIGHALGDPRGLLGALLATHLLAAAFWVGALAPLHRAGAGVQGAALLHRFGRIASVTVGILILAGAWFAWLMSGGLSALFGTAYGWVLLGKLGVVAGLMGMAAHNKWRLVPALAADRPGAVAALRRSIRLEMIAVAIILIVTATLTSVTTPPVNL